jgi:hypothetical protein
LRVVEERHPGDYARILKDLRVNRTRRADSGAERAATRPRRAFYGRARTGWPARFVTSRASGSAAVWSVFALTLAVLFLAAFALRRHTPTVYADGDPAIIELYTWQALHGLWVYGPYSRFGWHHPGPLYFYLLAPLYAASGQHTLALDAAASALLRFARPPMIIALCGALAVYVHAVARLLTSVWNPHVLLLPFGALVIAGAITMAGRLPLLPLVLAIGSFVAQTHAGLVPCVGVICLCAVAGSLWQTRDQPASSRWPWIAGSALLMLVLWFPTLFEQFTSSTGGNLAAMLHFFGPSGPSGANISFVDALAVWADTLTTPIRAQITVPYGNIITPTQGWVLPALAFAEVAALGLAAWYLRARAATGAALALLCAITSIVALAAVGRIRGGLIDHLIGWVALLGVLNVGVLLGTAFTWIDERRPRLFAPLAWATPLAGVALVLFTNWYGPARLEFERQEVIRKASGGRTPTQALYQELQVTLTQARIRKPLIHAAMLSWPQAAGIALQLTKTGTPFASDLIWLLGPQVTPRGDEDADITVADVPTRRTLSRRPGDCMLMERHGTSLHLLAEPPERFAALTCVTP